MQITKYFVFILTLWLCFSCNTDRAVLKKIEISNPLPFDRDTEIVAIDLQDITDRQNLQFGIALKGDDATLLSQIIDLNGDNLPDQLLFQPAIAGNSSVMFELIKTDIDSDLDEGDPTCYSRFVPERTDDYAWENDKVAFRTFGPEAQRMKEAGIQGGTLTSGIDAWLKRVNYPIINKWYEKETSGAGSYHEDTGEGLDNFHVGISRGIGGSAVKHEGKYSTSKNFVSWKTHYVGPLRTSFTLTYDTWDVGEKSIRESKTITLDKGSYLSHFRCIVEGTDIMSIGLTLHENDGITDVNKDQGWTTYWQPHGDSELGTAVIVSDNAMIDYDKYVSSEKDQSNLYSLVKVENNQVSYFAGFGWKKGGQFSNQEDWNNYIKRFALQLEEPLRIQYH